MKKIIIIAAVFFCAGCASIGSPISNDSISMIKQGETTETQIFEIFGKPSSKTLTAEGKILLNYIYTKAVGLKVNQEMLSILINDQGVVDKYTFYNSFDAK